MYTIERTTAFDTWLGAQSVEVRIRIADRIVRATAGNLGDVKYFDGIGEMRVSYGPGYRVYFVRRGLTLILLLFGGDKRTQPKDIKRAIQMLKKLKE